MEKKCKWCGKLFSVTGRRNNAKKYCSPECRDEGYKERHLHAQRNYKKRWKNLPQQEDRGYMLGEVQISQHRSESFTHEKNIIKREMRRIGL